MTTRWSVLHFLLVGIVWLVGQAHWPPALAGEPRSLDDQLLDDLMTDPLDPDVERELFSPADPGAGAEPKPPSDQPTDELNEQLLRELGAAAAPEDESPLLGIARQMRRVEGRIAQSDSGSTTQDLQQDGVASLEKLIEQARKRCQQCQASASPSQAVAMRQPIKQPGKKPGSGRGKPNPKPVQDSNAKPGTAEARRPDREEMESLVRGMRIWGELPENERQQMINAWIEEFLPKYRLLIEEYFKRLAEEERH